MMSCIGNEQSWAFGQQLHMRAAPSVPRSSPCTVNELERPHWASLAEISRVADEVAFEAAHQAARGLVAGVLVDHAVIEPFCPRI